MEEKYSAVCQKCMGCPAHFTLKRLFFHRAFWDVWHLSFLYHGCAQYFI